MISISHTLGSFFFVLILPIFFSISLILFKNNLGDKDVLTFNEIFINFGCREFGYEGVS